MTFKERPLSRWVTRSFVCSPVSQGLATIDEIAEQVFRAPVSSFGARSPCREQATHPLAMSSRSRGGLVKWHKPGKFARGGTAGPANDMLGRENKPR